MGGCPGLGAIAIGTAQRRDAHLWSPQSVTDLQYSVTAVDTGRPPSTACRSWFVVMRTGSTRSQVLALMEETRGCRAGT